MLRKNQILAILRTTTFAGFIAVTLFAMIGLSGCGGKSGGSGGGGGSSKSVSVSAAVKHGGSQ